MHGLAGPLILPLERRRHLGLPSTETGSKHDVADREGSLLRLAVSCPHDGYVPLLGLLVEGGPLRVESRLSPDIDLEHINV